MYNAEGVFELLNYHNQDLTLDHLVEIKKQSAPEEVEEGQKPESEPKERAMTVLCCLRGLDTLMLALRCLSKPIQISTVQQQLDKNFCTCLLACCDEILNGNKRSLSCETSVLVFFKSSSGTLASPPVLLHTRDNDPDDLPMLQRGNVSSLNCNF